MKQPSSAASGSVQNSAGEGREEEEQERQDEATLPLPLEQESGDVAPPSSSEGETISDWWQTIPESPTSTLADEKGGLGPSPSAEATFVAQQDNRAAQEEEEPRRRRTWILPLPLPGGEQLVANRGQVPHVQGNPPAPVPYVRGRPPRSPKASGHGEEITSFQPPAEQPVAPAVLPATSSSASRRSWQPLARPSSGPPAWLTLALVAFCAALLITSSTVAAAFTIWSPTLALLSGSSTVTPGGLLHLHGSHFLPGSTVTLTLDRHLPLHFSSHMTPQQRPQQGIVAAELFDPATLAWQALEGNSLQTRGDGTFDATLTIDPAWPLGQHSIQAQEALTSRSASLTFTIVRASPTPSTTSSPTPTVEVSPSSSPTATATSSATATAPPPTGGLSCVNPSAVTFGPLSAGYSAPVEQNITLCASGTGAVGWTASWDSQQAPWLSMSTTSGLLAAPGEEQLSLSASVGTLAAGRYSTEISFSDDAGHPAQVLQVTLIVVKPCLSVSPTSLSFTAVASTSDPAPQTLTIQSCSGLESWSATLQLETKQVWLHLSSNSGTLNANRSTSIRVSVSSLQTNLAAGSYQGQILLSSGQSQLTIPVTLTVQPAPALTLDSPESGTLQANRDCQLSSSEASWQCLVTIGAASENAAALNWSSSSSGISGITFTPAAGTLPPGQTVSIQVSIPTKTCPSSALLLFEGPANSIKVSWSCTPSVS
ncbi:BACON domain-containing protein [Thermogemmatispora carboxidivorans]|uniref:BACON domain-containing protein n=1 Tax=Thermogemmatispora carboxidivorans TaxID=1382306 RepID=UPI0012DE5484|nr:BACON domain-containing protein [Thermogemmatispora carboxidivorans]